MEWDIGKYFKERQDGANERISSNRKLLFDVLEKNKISRLEVTFDGCGDSGGMESYKLKPNKEHLLNEPVYGAKILHHIEFTKGGPKFVYEEEATIHSLIDSMCYDALEAFHMGWETNEGSFGKFVFDVKNKKIVLSFNEKVFDHETDETQFVPHKNETI